jgi:hypothetical protein
MMNLVNMTPHKVVIETDTEVVVLAPSGVITRIADHTEPDRSLHTVHGEIEVIRSRQGAVVDLPLPNEGTIYVVSRLVAERCRHRSDLVYPAGTRRSEAGQVVACRWLGRPDNEAITEAIAVTDLHPLNPFTGAQ